jgi:hypothetical protein
VVDTSTGRSFAAGSSEGRAESHDEILARDHRGGESLPDSRRGRGAAGKRLRARHTGDLGRQVAGLIETFEPVKRLYKVSDVCGQGHNVNREHPDLGVPGDLEVGDCVSAMPDDLLGNVGAHQQ